MSKDPFRLLGSRLKRCRSQAALDVETLAERARLSVEALQRFEGGGGGIQVTGLARAARVLGVPAATFIHTDAPEARAYREPTVLLRAQNNAFLREEDYRALAEMTVRARAYGELGDLLNAKHLADGFVPSVAPRLRPYEDGYAIARKARAIVPEREGPLKNVQRLIENRFNVLVLRLDFQDRTVLGAACRTGAARLVVVAARIATQAQARFVLAHELGHHLMDLEVEGASVDEGHDDEASWWLENPPGEKRANAFAAMFLAPELAVWNALGKPRGEGYGLADAEKLVSKASQHFGVSFSAMAWHLHNLRYLRDDATVKALLGTPRPNEAGAELEEEVRYNGLERRVFEALERDLISEAKARELLGGPVPRRDL